MQSSAAALGYCEKFALMHSQRILLYVNLIDKTGVIDSVSKTDYFHQVLCCKTDCLQTAVMRPDQQFQINFAALSYAIELNVFYEVGHQSVSWYLTIGNAAEQEAHSGQLATDPAGTEGWKMEKEREIVWRLIYKTHLVLFIFLYKEITS